MCAGIPRSGSTWLYNAARLLLACGPVAPEAVYGAWIEQYDPSHRARFHVVKVHDPNEALSWRSRCTLTSRRDLRDIAASAWKRGWIADESSTIAFLENVVRQHAFWSARAAHEMIYERMRSDGCAALAAIAQAMNLHLDSDVLGGVERRINALGHDETSPNDFNPANLLHKNHIMDGRVGYHAQTLPADILRRINQRFNEWLIANGYAS